MHHEARGEPDQLIEGCQAVGTGELRPEKGFLTPFLRRGRVGIFELLMVDDQVRKRIQERANASEIRDTALERAMQLLRDDGIIKILEGTTTVEEVSRVTVRATM